MAIYNGFDINTAATPKPWGAREEQAIKDIIDTLVGDTIDAEKQTSGHLHGMLYNSSSSAVIDASTATEITVSSTVAMGANAISYDGTSGNGIFFNSSNEIFAHDVLHISNNTNAFYSGNSEPVVYSSADTGGAYPFLEAGHLVFQARQTAGRDLVFVTGATPATRMSIDDAGVVDIVGAATVNDLDVTTNIDTATMTATGTVGVNDLDVTTNIDTATMTATGTVGINDLNVTTNIDAATLATTGSVGIGTSSPQEELHVSGSAPVLRLSDNNSANTTEATGYVEYYHGENTTRLGYIGYGSSGNADLSIRNELAGEVVMYSNNTERMAIGSAGTVGVNNTTPDTSAHAEYGDLIIGNTSLSTSGVTIQASTTGVGAIVFNDTNAGFQGAIQYNHSADYMRFITSGAVGWYIASDGGFYANGLSSQGAGTINATAVYDDGVGPLTDYVFERHYDKNYVIPEGNEPAKTFDIRYEICKNLESLISFVKDKKCFPAFNNGGEKLPIGESFQKLLETVEMLMYHFDSINTRLKILEAV